MTSAGGSVLFDVPTTGGGRGFARVISLDEISLLGRDVASTRREIARRVADGAWAGHVVGDNMRPERQQPGVEADQAAMGGFLTGVG